MKVLILIDFIVTEETLCKGQTVTSQTIGNLCSYNNGDGINDTYNFTIVGAKGISVSFSIMNRWGNSLTPALSEVGGVVPSQRVLLWNGRTTSGMDCSEGIYFYTLEYKDAKGDTQKKNGCVTLIR